MASAKASGAAKDCVAIEVRGTLLGDNWLEAVMDSLPFLHSITIDSWLPYADPGIYRSAANQPVRWIAKAAGDFLIVLVAIEQETNAVL